MKKCFEYYLLYSGQKYEVYFHAETNVFSSVFNYFEQCDEITQASLLNLVKRISEVGTIYDESKFRIEDKQNKIYFFKPKKERFFCFFFTGRKIIITSGYTKKQQKLNRRELVRAIRIKDQYQKGV